LSAKTRNVPAGRPPGTPPWTWEESANDALTMKGFDKAKTWPVEAVAYRLEAYNGWGYWSSGFPIPPDQLGVSPYLWAACVPGKPYRIGKFTRDHFYDPDVVDRQLGCMPLLQRMAALDGSIKLVSESAPAPKIPGAPAPVPPPLKPAPPPKPAAPARTGIAALLVGAAAALAAFGRDHWVFVACALALAGIATFLILRSRK